MVVRIHIQQKINTQKFLRKAKFQTEKKRNERKFKIFRLPFFISQQKRLFDQNSFKIQISLGVFQSNENESRKILIFAALTFISFIFRYEICMPNMWTY
jgi:hypothetical protein